MWVKCFVPSVFSSANSMPKQVEVRMHESHLEPIEARPQSKCAQICSKMFKNLLLTLTVLGQYLNVSVSLISSYTSKNRHHTVFCYIIS